MDSPKSLYNLSSDWHRLFKLLCEGHLVAAFVDNPQMKKADGKPQRDICQILRRREYDIQLSVRGTGYGGIWPFMEEEGAEEDLFVTLCQSCNLAWIDPEPSV